MKVVSVLGFVFLDILYVMIVTAFLPDITSLTSQFSNLKIFLCVQLQKLKSIITRRAAQIIQI